MATPMEDSVTGKSQVPHHLVPTQKTTVGSNVRQNTPVAPSNLQPSHGLIPNKVLKNRSRMTITPREIGPGLGPITGLPNESEA